MSNKVLLKKSSVANKAPLVTDLDYGELAINYADERVYFKNANNEIKYLSTAGIALETLSFGTGLSGNPYTGISAVTVDLADTTVTPGTYGSQTEIPVLTIDQQGRITLASTVSVSSTLPIAGDTGTDNVSLLTDTLSFVGGTGISSAVTDNTVTFTNTAPNVTTDISITHNASTVSVNSSDGADGTINAATTSLAGVMSAADKTKLDGIATGAEVNQNAFSNFAVSGQTTVAADSKTDTLNLVAGTNVTITTDAATDSITISANDTSVNWSEIQNKPDPVVTVTLTGDVTGTGNATLTDLSNGTISFATTIAANSVALGTDTTGNYMVNVAAGGGIDVSHTQGEGSTATVSHADTSSVANLSSDNANGTVIQDVSLTFDTYGHVTGSTVGTVNLDSRYYTETESDNRFVNVTGDTMTGFLTLHADPTNNLHAATKQYVDTLSAASLHYHDPVRVESPVALNANYNNGTSGVGATLTNAGTLTALVIDGVTLSLNDRVLVYNQTNSAHNGIYYVSNVGSASVAWVLTRTLDTDSYGASDPTALGTGDAFFVKEGDTGAGELYVMTTEGTITFGTTLITFSQISSAQIYSAGSGLTLTNTQFAHADTSSVGNVSSNNSNGTVIQDVSFTFDGFGHVTAASVATVDLDSRYVELSGDTMTGDLTIEDGVLKIGDLTPNNNYLQLEQSGNGYGFTAEFGNMSVLRNMQGSTNQAMVLGDTSPTNNSTLFGISATTDGGTNWTKKLNLTGTGDLYVGSSGTDKVWHEGNDGAASGLDADLLDGQHGSHYLDWNNTTNKPDPVITVTLTGDVTGTANTTLTDLASGTVSVATTIAANSVALGTDTTGNYVAGISAGGGITVSGSGSEGATVTVSHTDTSSQASVDNSNGTVIQDITLDTYGHITAIGSVNLDGRYFTETEADGRFVLKAGDTMTGTLVIKTANSNNQMSFYTEDNTAQIADTFDGVTDKSYIFFTQTNNSNDPGYIMHETRDTTETNEGVLHLVPSDDNAYGDYISIHGTNDPDQLKLHTDGTIEGVKDLTASGTISAATKSFLIPHPTKEGKKLRYGSLEGPENGVYVRGKLDGTNVIELPEYWTKLVDPDSITVQLTAIGKEQKLYVKDIRDNKVFIASAGIFSGDPHCFYFIQAERIDVDKLEVEID